MTDTSGAVPPTVESAFLWFLRSAHPQDATREARTLSELDSSAKARSSPPFELTGGAI